MFKSIARKPVTKTNKYLKYGFVIMECESRYCPRCGEVLNVGPGYQPRYCSRCGQKISFEGVEWKDDKMLGYTEGREILESIKDRVV